MSSILKLFFLICCVLFRIDSLAQIKGFPYGMVSRQELSMKSYAFDSTASALVLNEFGDAFFEDGKIIFNYHVKVKILKSEGTRQANFRIVLRKNESNQDELVDLQGMTHFMDGSQLKSRSLEKHLIFREVNPTYELVKFALPNAQVGSVLEVSYQIKTPFILVFWPWEFQSEIPKIYSEYHAKIPANYTYNISLRGYLKLTKNETGLERDCFSFGSAKADCSTLIFGMKDVPAFREEEFMTASSNFISAINFELSEIKYFDGRIDKVTKEWKDVEQELVDHNDFGGQIKKARKVLEDKVKEITAGVSDPLVRAKKIYAWIKANYNWNERFGKYADKGIKYAFENKKGNVGDINLSLLGALQSADLNANPVLLSTRDNGLPNSLYPVLSDFNYVVVQLVIDTNTYLLDATDHYLPFGLLPERCLNGKGRLLAKKNSVEIDLTPKSKGRIVNTLNIKLGNDGELKGAFQVSSFDYKALEKRKSIKSFSNLESYRKELIERWSLKDVKNLTIENLDDHEKPLLEKMEIEFNPHDASSVAQIYFNPFMVGQWNANPFKSTQRNFPIDFGVSQEEITLLSVEFPASFKIDEKPPNVALALPNKGGTSKFSYTELNDKLNIYYSLNLTKPIYDAAEYLSLKDLFERMIQIKQTDLVFVKK